MASQEANPESGVQHATLSRDNGRAILEGVMKLVVASMKIQPVDPAWKAWTPRGCCMVLEWISQFSVDAGDQPQIKERAVNH